MAMSCHSINMMVARSKVRKSTIRASQTHNDQLPAKSSVSIRDSKVYDDQRLGIMCYIDGKGEIVCEGCDEGPRLSRRCSATKEQRRKEGHEMTDLLKILKLQKFEEDKFYFIIHDLH